MSFVALSEDPVEDKHPLLGHKYVEHTGAPGPLPLLWEWPGSLQGVSENQEPNAMLVRVMAFLVPSFAGAVLFVVCCILSCCRCLKPCILRPQ